MSDAAADAFSEWQPLWVAEESRAGRITGYSASQFQEHAFLAGFAAGGVAALEQAAEDVDLSEFYDPDPRGLVSQECGHAESAAHRWLSDRAAQLRDGNQPKYVWVDNPDG